MASASVIFEGKNNTVLLQLRDNKTNNYPEMWGLFGGTIENNETPIQAAVREMKEELGIDLQEKNLKLFLNIKNGNEEYYIFRSKFIWNIKDIELKEGKDMKFFSKKEFLKLNNIIPPVKKFWKIC